MWTMVGLLAAFFVRLGWGWALSRGGDPAGYEADEHRRNR